MLAAFPRLGKSLFPRSTWRQSIVGDEFADVSEVMLTALLTSAGPRALTALNDTAYDMIAAWYELGGLTELQHDFLRQTIAVDIEIAMSALHALALSCLRRALTANGPMLARNSPTSAGTPSGDFGTWLSLATRFSRSGSRWRTSLTRRYGGGC